MKKEKLKRIGAFTLALMLFVGSVPFMNVRAEANNETTVEETQNETPQSEVAETNTTVLSESDVIYDETTAEEVAEATTIQDEITPLSTDDVDDGADDDADGEDEILVPEENEDEEEPEFETYAITFSGESIFETIVITTEDGTGVELNETLNGFNAIEGVKYNISLKFTEEFKRWLNYGDYEDYGFTETAASDGKEPVDGEQVVYSAKGVEFTENTNFNVISNYTLVFNVEENNKDNINEIKIIDSKDKVTKGEWENGAYSFIVNGNEIYTVIVNTSYFSYWKNAPEEFKEYEENNLFLPFNLDVYYQMDNKVFTENLEYTPTFSKHYEVSTSTNDKSLGTISVNGSAKTKVDANNSCTITIKPNLDKFAQLTKLEVNDEEVDLSDFVYISDVQGYEYKINSVVKTTKVEAEFEEAEGISWEEAEEKYGARMEFSDARDKESLEDGKYYLANSDAVNVSFGSEYTVLNTTVGTKNQNTINISYSNNTNTFKTVIGVNKLSGVDSLISDGIIKMLNKHSYQLVYIDSEVSFIYETNQPSYDYDLGSEWFNPNVSDALYISGSLSFCGFNRLKEAIYSTEELVSSEGNSIRDQICDCTDDARIATIKKNSFKFTLSGTNRPTETQGYWIYALDRYGNVYSMYKTFKADSTAPSVNFKYDTSFLTKLVNHATKEDKISIYVSAEDTESGVASFDLYIDGEVVATESADNNSACKFTDIELAKNKAHVIEISATDNVNNVSAATSYIDTDGTVTNRPIYQDSIAPVVTLSPNDSMVENNGIYYFSGDPTVKINAIDCQETDSDQPSGIDKIEIKLGKKTISSIHTSNGSVAIADYFKEYDSRATNETFTLTTEELGELEENRLYTLTVRVYDCAGNVSEDTEFKLYWDTLAPEIKSFTVEGEKSEIPVSYTNEEGFYGYFVNDAATLKVVANDEGVGVKQVEFYTVTSDGTKSEVTNYRPTTTTSDDEDDNEPVVDNTDDEIVNINGNSEEEDSEDINEEITGDSDDETPGYVKEYKAEENDEFIYIPLDKDFKGYVFVRAEDRVNNIQDSFTTTSGVITETPALHENQEESHITLSTEKTSYKDAAGNNLYNHSTSIDVQVNDVVSGIKNISWSVEANYDTGANHSGQVDIDGNVVENKAGRSVKYSEQDLVKGTDNSSWEITSEDKNLVTGMNYSIPVTNNSNDIVITVTVTDRSGNTSTESTKISIDTTQPTVAIQYDNNDADPEYTNYYQANRTATITVTERNFNAEDFKLSLTSTGKVTPSLSSWVETKNYENPDLTTYKATIVFDTDGDYEFDASFHDMAGNKPSEMFDKQQFTIDKTIPVIEISFDNNSAMNGNYYKASRTATIKITEHNFDAKRVTVTGTATDDGVTKTFPSISNFSTSGDENTATITFDADGDYKFTVECTDKARNVAEAKTADEFVVDLTVPEVTISGIENMSANNGDVAPIIVMSDTNYDVNNVEINLVGSNNGTVNYANAASTSDHGQTISFSNFAEEQSVDDIYTLEATATDKAGNETTEQITFSVNRFGSVYTFSDATKSILEKYTNSPVDIEITETNVDELSMDNVKLVVTYNGTPTTLSEGSDFTVSKNANSASWSQYTYKIGKEYFDKDGAYAVSIYSVDMAGNENENNDETKKATCTFGVDTTAPVIVPITIDSNEIYNAQTYKANISINDNLVLDDVEATVNGTSVDFTNDGDDYTFPIEEENTKQSITVTATDAAGNSVSYTANNIIVSTNAAVRIYNNKRLFVSLCAGALTGCVAAIFFVRMRLKKKAKALNK